MSKEVSRLLLQQVYVVGCISECWDKLSTSFPVLVHCFSSRCFTYFIPLCVMMPVSCSHRKTPAALPVFTGIQTLTLQRLWINSIVNCKTQRASLQSFIIKHAKQRVSSCFSKSNENNNPEVSNTENFSPAYTILAKLV